MRTNWNWVVALLGSVALTVLGAIKLDRAITRNHWKLNVDLFGVGFLACVLVALWVIWIMIGNAHNASNDDDTPGWIIAIVSAGAAIGLWEFGKRVEWEHTGSTLLLSGALVVIAVIIVSCAMRTRELVPPVPAVMVVQPVPPTP